MLPTQGEQNWENPQQVDEELCEGRVTAEAAKHRGARDTWRHPLHYIRSLNGVRTLKGSLSS